MEANLKKFIAAHDRIFIFGIGNYSAALADRLRELDLAFDGFIATSKTEPDQFTQMPVDNFMDHPVFSVDDHEIIMMGGGGCILALPEKYQPSAEELLVERGLKNFLRLSDEYMLENVRRSNELTPELVDEFRQAIPFQTVRHKPWRNIFTVCLGGIGDMILTEPFLRKLRRNHPNANITLVTTPITYELMLDCPLVDHVSAFDWKKNIGTLRARMSTAKNFVDAVLRAHNIDAFDAAILPAWDVDLYGASFLIFFSRAAVRLGYSEHVNQNRSRHNKNFDLLFTDVLDDRSLRHESERGLQLLKRNGDEKLIILGVSATAPHRIWDRKNFAELVNRLHAWRDDLRFVLIGAGDAVDKAAYIIEHTPRGVVVDLTNRLSLKESAALCHRASLYVGNNTGTMHLAAASAKCVAIISLSKDGDIFHSDSPQRTAPRGEGHVIIQPEHALDDCVGHCCKPFAHCINQITVEEVCNAVKNIFSEGV